MKIPYNSANYVFGCTPAESELPTFSVYWVGDALRFVIYDKENEAWFDLSKEHTRSLIEALKRDPTYSEPTVVSGIRCRND